VSLTEIFLVVPEIRLPVPTYPKFALPYYSILRRLWTKVHTIFFTFVNHLRHCLQWKLDGSCSRNFL